MMNDEQMNKTITNNKLLKKTLFNSYRKKVEEKRHFWSHLYAKFIFLPRQAQDKHRESTQKRAVLQTKLEPRPGTLIEGKKEKRHCIIAYTIMH
jgi:hypothetical protein